MKEAVREARQKARAIAEALEVRLLEPREVTEGGIFVRPLFFEGAALRGAADAAGTPVLLGQVNVTASVTVRFRIDPTRKKEGS